MTEESNVNESNEVSEVQEDHGSLVAARREKKRQIEELGIDPWGSRFDDRVLIGDIRSRLDEVKFQKEDGTLIDLPELHEDPEQRINMRQWRSDNGPGTEIGPQVRAAGRIMLQRDKGKLRFIDIQDWTGNCLLYTSDAADE